MKSLAPGRFSSNIEYTVSKQISGTNTLSFFYEAPLRRMDKLSSEPMFTKIHDAITYY